MTVYRKCRPCSHRDGCEIKARLAAAIKGFSVGSLSHACKSYAPDFKPGDNVWVRAQDIPFSYDEGTSTGVFPAHFEGTSTGVFPAHFVGYSKTLGRAIVYIAPGSKSQCGELEFQPANGKEGFCKVSYAPYRARHKYSNDRGIIERRDGRTNVHTCCGRPIGTSCTDCQMFHSELAL